MASMPLEKFTSNPLLWEVALIVARIVDALGPQTRAEMADSAVARCMATLTRASASSCRTCVAVASSRWTA